MTANAHDYQCPTCGFTSIGWPTKKAAAERGAAHRVEHETGKPMRETTEES